ASREAAGPQQGGADREAGTQRAAAEEVSRAAALVLVEHHPSADDAADYRGEAERRPVAALALRERAEPPRVAAEIERKAPGADRCGDERSDEDGKRPISCIARGCVIACEEARKRHRGKAN